MKNKKTIIQKCYHVDVEKNRATKGKNGMNIFIYLFSQVLQNSELQKFQLHNYF